MAGFAEYEAYDGLGLADLVQRHEVTPAPQKGNRVVHLPARRSAVHIGCEGFPEKQVRSRSIVGLEVAEREMPIQVAI